jgi:hypothetical protein
VQRGGESALRWSLSELRERLNEGPAGAVIMAGPPDNHGLHRCDSTWINFFRIRVGCEEGILIVEKNFYRLEVNTMGFVGQL